MSAFSEEELVLERKDGDETAGVTNYGNAVLMVTPPLNEDFWMYRVRVSNEQAVVGFPKFFTTGIGFAVEDEEWNTNLPYVAEPDDIASHIWVNHGPSLTEADRPLVIHAIKMIQEGVIQDLKKAREAD